EQLRNSSRNLEDMKQRSGEFENMIGISAMGQQSAKQELDKERDAAVSKRRELDQQIISMSATIAGLETQVAKADALHKEETESLKRMNQAAAEQATTAHAGELAKMLGDMDVLKRRELEQIAMLHQQVLLAKQQEWQSEGSRAVNKVEGNSHQLGDIQARVASDREKSLKERGERILSLERHLEMRESQLEAREREITQLKAQLESVMNSVESTSRETQHSLGEERARLTREHHRAETLLQTLNIERVSLQDQVSSEKQALEQSRDARAREREQFLTECLEEKKQLAMERAELGQSREKALNAEVEARKRLADVEGKIASSTAQYEQEGRYCEEMRKVMEEERRKLAAEREQLELEKRVFHQETQRLTQLGLQTQQKSEEMAQLRDDALAERQQAERIYEETRNEQRSIEQFKRSIDEEHRQFAEQKRFFEEERVRIAKERQQAAHERTAAMQASEQARALQMKLADRMRRHATDGTPLDMSAMETEARAAGLDISIASDRSNLPSTRTSKYPIAKGQENTSPPGPARQQTQAANVNPASRHRVVLAQVRSSLQEIGIDLGRWEQERQASQSELASQETFLQQIRESPVPRPQQQQQAQAQAQAQQGPAPGPQATGWEGVGRTGTVPPWQQPAQPTQSTLPSYTATPMPSHGGDASAPPTAMRSTFTPLSSNNGSGESELSTGFPHLVQLTSTTTSIADLTGTSSILGDHPRTSRVETPADTPAAHDTSLGMEYSFSGGEESIGRPTPAEHTTGSFVGKGPGNSSPASGLNTTITPSVGGTLTELTEKLTSSSGEDSAISTTVPPKAEDRNVHHTASTLARNHLLSTLPMRFKEEQRELNFINQFSYAWLVRRTTIDFKAVIHPYSQQGW
ncbi:hypothetical protein CYMTET_27838, partial [Cymbomonas tetramitiformis]